jgi:formamidopyrimidine-DNA glycosylase
VRLASPFVLRSVAPSIGEAEGKRVTSAATGKRIVFALEGDFLVLHLMIAGRLRWVAAV